MKRLKTVRVLLFALIGLAWASFAQAQATRTWVSGVGDDANPCSRTAPCKTFAGAISKTAAGGEIDALDPGGFGTVTITKSITIDGGGGIVASVLASGVNGIVVSAGASDIVVLRNLQINGAGTTLGVNGIRFLSGKALHVDRCSIFEFGQNGIDIQPSTTASVFITDTKLQRNGGNGINISSASVASAVQINVTATNTVSEGNSGKGLFAGDHASAAVRHSVFNGNTGDGLTANGVSHGTAIFIDDTTSSFNGGAGVNAIASISTIRFGNMQISGNGAAFALSSSGVLQSFGNNSVTGNVTIGPTPMVIPQS